MHKTITLDHYLGPHKDNPAARATVVLANAAATIALANALCEAAQADGVALEDNPATGNAISGNGNGGIRPPDSTVGASGSKHKDANAVDRYDPKRSLMKWVLANPSKVTEVAEKLGAEIAFEHPQWTRSWCHIQRILPGSRNRVFVPYSDLEANPPTCAALPEQADAGVTAFKFAGRS